MLSHEKLNVYQSAIKFLALCSRLRPVLPRGSSALADQLTRASLSIPLNIAEGAGKTTQQDTKRFYAIARGSAMECGAILDAARVLEALDEKAVEEGKVLLEEIVRILSKMCR